MEVLYQLSYLGGGLNFNGVLAFTIPRGQMSSERHSCRSLLNLYAPAICSRLARCDAGVGSAQTEFGAMVARSLGDFPDRVAQQLNGELPF